MADIDKPYTVYRGGHGRGTVPQAQEDGEVKRARRGRFRGRRRLRLWLLVGGLLLGLILFLVGWGIAGYVALQGGVGDAGKRIDAATRTELSAGGGALPPQAASHRESASTDTGRRGVIRLL